MRGLHWVRYCGKRTISTFPYRFGRIYMKICSRCMACKNSYHFVAGIYGKSGRLCRTKASVLHWSVGDRERNYCFSILGLSLGRCPNSRLSFTFL